jgi:hypothetical protein
MDPLGAMILAAKDYRYFAEVRFFFDGFHCFHTYKNNTMNNIIVKDKKNPNFYSLVIMYIKQNFHKTVKTQVTQVNLSKKINPVENNKNNNKNNNMNINDSQINKVTHVNLKDKEKEKEKEVETSSIINVNKFNLNEEFIENYNIKNKEDNNKETNKEILENIAPEKFDLNNETNLDVKSKNLIKNKLGNLVMSDKEKHTLMSELKDFMENEKQKQPNINPILAKYIITIFYIMLLKTNK